MISTAIKRTRRFVHPRTLVRIHAFVLIWRMIKTMRENDATHMAAGVAYYAFFSLFPLLLGLLSIVGIILASPETQDRLLSYWTDNLPGSKGFVTDNVIELVELRGALGIGAFLGLLWATSGLFTAINRAVNRAWHIPRERPFYIAKPRQLVLAFAVASLFLLSALTTLAIEVIADPARNLGIPGQGLLRDLEVAERTLWIVPWLASFSIFVLLYKFAPDCKTYWKYVWTGAVVAAVLFELGKWSFLWYLENVARYSQVYGSVASVIVLLTWIYLSAMILILGAEVSSEYSRVQLRRAGHSLSGIFSGLGHGKAAGRNGVHGLNGHQSASPAEANEPAASQSPDN